MYIPHGRHDSLTKNYTELQQDKIIKVSFLIRVFPGTKDGEPFDTALFGERIIQHRGIGTLYFSKPLATDEGIYQCFAKNYYGISLSNSISLRKSELHFFPLEKPKVVDVVEGSLLSLKCDPPKGHPKPAVFWMIQPNSGEPRSINSSRVSVDPEGGLHFSNVTKEDALDDAVYACIVSSLFRSELKVGNRRKINVIPREIKGPIFQPPVKQYVSPSKITVLEGDKLELTCIYGGTPIPTVKWYFTKKGLISRERLDKPVKIDKTFLIKSVDSDSEGSYQCVADNGVGSEQIYSITVTVE
ncbi:neuroglian-like [Limulus polyphemus]|uniref:Neuroglian-like n=1 Tax=Limulus polyphemus TaxID=6850 RepID=A0ABM1BQ78_LIMPO|nr:neuroglian-like [Limulus polyphemus]